LSLGNKILELRKKKGLSIIDMARLLGFKSKVTYYNIENGISEPKISNINDISIILGKSAKNFFNFKVQKNWYKEAKVNEKFTIN